MINDKIIALFEVLFDKMLGWIIGPFRGDLDSLHTLIYENNDLYYGIFDEKQFGVVAQGMAIMQSLSVGIILISIVIAGMRISSSGINPSNRTSVIEYFKDFIIVALLFFNLSTIFELIFTVNSYFVAGFESSKDIIAGESTLDKVTTAGSNFADKGVLGNLIIALCLLGLWIWANFYYMMRTITIMLLMIISPVAVALYLVPQTKGITIGVFKEFTGVVLVQCIHAFTYWVITAVASDDFGIGSVILYMIFIPITESIRSLLGLGGNMDGNLNKAAAMFGGSAIMGVIGAVKGAKDGESVMSLVKKGIGGVQKASSKGVDSNEDSDEPKGILAGAGTDIGTTARAERMLKSGEITSKMGKAAFGMAGAIAGSPMGPKGSLALGTIGFTGGGIVGGLSGRSGMAGVEGVANRLKAGGSVFADKFKGAWNGEKLADEKLANTLADGEATAWATENKESFMKGLKERFPDADDHSLNKIWDKEVSGKKEEFLDKAHSTVGKMKSTSGRVAKAADLMDSTVNNLTDDWAKNNKDSFMKDFDTSYPLPVNATAADIQKHNTNKNLAWDKAVQEKKNAISSIASNSIGKLGLGSTNAKAKDIASTISNLTNEWAKDNKESFLKDYDSSNPLPPNATEEDRKSHNMNRNSAWNKTVQAKKDAIGKSLSGVSTGLGNVATTVNSITNDWANSNKENFIKDYDASNPLPPNASDKDIQTHNTNRDSAWDKAVKEKKVSITKTVSSLASNKLGLASESILVNKEDFINEVGGQVGSIIGKGAREGLLAVKGATRGVQNASLYSGKSVNTDFVASHLASMKTQDLKEAFIETAKSNGISHSQAQIQWNTQGAPETFAKQLSNLTTKAPSDGGLPRHIPLDHRIIGNTTVKGLSGVVTGIVAGAGELTGITPTAKFIGDTKLAAGAIGSVLGAKEAWNNQNPTESLVTTGIKTVGGMGKSFVSHYKGHVPENVVQKQANFRNANAYLHGVVGGVRGYKLGATAETPYDNLVNDQVKEISEIQQMVQMVGPKGQEQITSGAIRMVTTRGQSVIQVRDKTGNIQTVSRIASGDSSLAKGETLYQDLSIQDGQFTSASNVYKEDSGGGRVTLNRSINVNPNRIIANRNTPKEPKVIQEVQSYNQLVDSGQYTQKQAVAEMKDIRMVVDRNRSYLVGNKDGNEYRISPYGRGDARLSINEVIERPCETVKSTGRIVVQQNEIYTSSTEPEDFFNVNNLLPRSKPNKRNMTRQLNEKFRNKSFTESLKG